MKTTIVPVLLLLFVPLSLPAQLRTVDLPEYTIHPEAGQRQFAYTNTQSAMYCGVVNGGNGSGFHGITEAQRKVFEDYWIRFGDTLLDRHTAEITMTPAGFTRRYPLYNTVEHVSFVDSLTLLIVSISTEYEGDVQVFPGWSTQWQDAVQSIGGGMYRLRDETLQGVAAVQGLDDGSWEVSREIEVAQLPNPSPLHMPVMYWGRCTGRLHLTIEIAPARLPLGIRPPPELFTYRKQRELRITERLSALNFECSDSMTADAFHWIAASMDALVMKQSGPGIYAGLPWDNEYRGRDTFISLPGALLAGGRFETAKEVLRSFLRRIDRDSSRAAYGRIPSHLQAEEFASGAVDGTAWSVIQAWNIYRYSGDTAFLSEIFPDVIQTVEGAFRHTDTLGFLIHADTDSWMDTVGPDGPRSPRGNRAVDVQSLWIAQLRAAAAMAVLCGDFERAREWEERANALTSHFLRYFLRTHADRISVQSGGDSHRRDPFGVWRRTPTLADHLNADGSKDAQDRPNVLLPLVLLGADALDAHIPGFASSVARHSARSCIFPWGVASLAQEDAAFRPFLDASRVDVGEKLPHNGSIWTWLTGPATSVLCDFGLEDSAWVLMQTLQRLAMETGAVGAIPESTDALPEEGEIFPRWSGAVSRASSNAEYLRVMQEDFMGIGVNASKREMILDPAVPRALSILGMTVRIGSQRVHIHYERAADDRLICELTMAQGTDTLTISPPASAEGDPLFALAHLTPGRKLTIRISTRHRKRAAENMLHDGFTFCRPHERE
ncbi:MAG: hypothetical protein JXA28_02060 [Bacteroidetes bacterium]|nr:hypothetical protein [Bacteroidota bacterium]